MTETPDFEQMIAAVTKTFIIAHSDDSDEKLAQALVFNAGRLAWRLREIGVETEYKTSHTDVVTVADRGAEQFIATALATLRPEDGVFGEEGASRESQSGRTWVIDPVDGTYNFVRGDDYFCSALALKQGDEVIFGAVHRPAMGYTWFGGKEYPTVLDGKPLAPLVDAPLSKVCLGTYAHPSFLQRPAVRDAWLEIAQSAAALRMRGSASVDLASLAQGVIGAWAQMKVKEWDWLPGRALVEGVGGECRTVEFGGISWCIAGNKQAVADLAAIMNA